MSKKILSILLALVMVLSMVPVSVFAQDDVLSCLTYKINNGEVTIKDCDTSISGDVVIPDTIDGYPVTSIDSWSFDNCESLTNVIIPNGVTSIEEFAFYNCESLTSITIPDSVTSIGECAFANCNSLTSITIPDSVTSIGGYAFGNTAYYNDESNWENGVLYIGNHLISAKENITECVIKEGTLTIAASAFKSFDSLISITIPDSVTSIGDKAFAFSSLESIIIPDSVTSIGDEAFYYCKGLTSITIPDNVTSIGDEAFDECKSLSNIIISDGATLIDVDMADMFNSTAYYNDESNWTNGVLYIGKHLIDAKKDITECAIKEGTLTIAASAFFSCESLTNITIPNGVKSIGAKAFYLCKSLTNVIIPDGVTEIGFAAFSNSGIQTITIPKTLTYINSYSFSETELSTVYYAGDDAEWEALNIISVPLLAEIHYKNENICYTLNNVNNGMATIVSCSEKISGDYAVPEVINGHPVIAIGPNAFESCTGLTSITIPESVKTIGDNAFAGCTSLTHINYLGSKETWNNSVSTGNLPEVMPNVTVIFPQASIQALEYSIVNGEAVITGCDISISGSLTIPDTLGGYPVTTIGNSAFYCCEYLESVTIPDSVTVIEAAAFEGCQNITCVIIGKNVKSIGVGSFKSCLALENITVSKDNKYFSSDSNGVLFDNDITMLIQYPINNSRTSYTIPSTVENICYGAFADAFNIKSVIIPDSVKTICEEAFWQCYNMTEITIGSGVQSIEDAAFTYCLSLSDVYYSGSKADWSKITIGDRNELTVYPTIHFGKNSNDKPVHNSSTVLTPNADSNIKVTNTVAAAAPEMSVEDIVKSVKNENVQILDKDGKELAKDVFVGTGSKIQVLDKDGKVLSEYEVMVKSDVDGNGKITPADARLALRASANLDKLEGVYETAANYDRKDKVSTSDARMILRKSAGLE